MSKSKDNSGGKRDKHVSWGGVDVKVCSPTERDSSMAEQGGAGTEWMSDWRSGDAQFGGSLLQWGAWGQNARSKKVQGEARRESVKEARHGSLAGANLAADWSGSAGTKVWEGEEGARDDGIAHVLAPLTTSLSHLVTSVAGVLNITSVAAPVRRPSQVCSAACAR